MNRITPQLPVHMMQTYGISQPAETHTREATCAEVECLARLRGWRTQVDVTTALGTRQARYIINQSGRRFERKGDGPIVEFVFHSGQTCFNEHRVPLDKPAQFYVVGGDWRQRTGPKRRHASAEDWRDDLGENQTRLLELQERG